MTMNKIYLNIIALVGMLLLMSCADEIVSSGATGASDDNAITLSLNSEAQPTLTRTRAISTGSHINQLIYKIYKKNATTSKFEEDTYYLAKNEYKIDDTHTLKNCAVIDEYQPGQQYNIRLIPNPADKDGQEYKIVCWAQEKDSKYFDLTKFPEEISVKYDEEENGNLTCTTNIEERDAFYCSRTFKVSEKGTNVKIVLKRPFAQINVGTSGWDYEGFATIEPDATVIKYSKMTISDVATAFSPLNNKCDASGLKTITFDWSKLPAYRNLNFEEIDEDNITGVYENDHNDGKKTNKPGIFTTAGVEEEFLQLMLKRNVSSTEKDAYDYADKKDAYEYSPYIGWKEYDRLCAEVTDHNAFLDSIFTETYKYLSMCYVLVPFTVTEDANGNEISRTNSPVRNITFDCAENKPAEGEKWTGVLGEGNSVLSLTQVPVGSNCRTNIITTDGTGLFMNANEMKVAIYSETFSDYYKRLHPQDAMWNDGGPNDSLYNNGYVWPGDDIESDKDKFPLAAPTIVWSNDKRDKQYFSPEENTVSTFAYINRDSKEFIFDDGQGEDAKEGRTRGNYKNKSISLNVNNLNISSDLYKFKYLIEAEELDSQYVTKESVSNKIEIPVRYLTDIITSKSIEKNTNVSGKELQIPYYSIKLTVETILPDSSNYRKPDDQTVTIKVYPIYEKYTFSEDSDDEGWKIWDNITQNGAFGSEDSKTEDGFKYIYSGNEQISEHISVMPRAGTGKNDKIFAITDHLKFRGAGGFTTSDAPNGIGHYVTLKQLAGSSKITVKIGRDEGQDNSNISKDNKALVYNDRQLKFQYNNAIAYGETWMALRLPNDNAIDDNGNHPDENTTQTTRYRVSETKIAQGYDVKLDNPGDVKISMSAAGFCFYWIIISETDDDM